MEPKVEISSQIIVRPQQATKVIMAKAQNFMRKTDPSDTYTRPLMVNAWSQTTSNDFEFLIDLKLKDEHTEREKELLEKIRVLEDNLKTHAELLSQIHETSARTSALLGHQTPPPYHLAKSIQIKTFETQASNQTVLKTNQMSPKKNNSHMSPTSSVINPLHSLGSANTESYKYTIIAEGSGDVNGEPIEIQLAEEDGALNLNSSADSGRLEICLAPEDNAEVKTETEDPVSHFNTSSPLEHNFIKKRKLEMYQNDLVSEKSSFHYTGQSLLKSSGETNSTNTNSFVKHHLTSQKQPNCNSLLKSLNNSSNMQTPMRPLMLSQNISISPMGGGSVSGEAGIERKIDTDHVMVSIGPNNTRIPAKVYEGMSWNSASIATRKLLMAVFDRKTLATHSMTGKPSPAFKDHGKPLKQMLDPVAIQDIIFAVTRKCNVSEKEVRNAITTKCADENKMMKLQLNKRTPMRELNKENIALGSLKTFKSEL